MKFFTELCSFSTMTSPVFSFYLVCLLLGKMAQATHQTFSSSYRQERNFVSANVGESFILQCFYEHDDDLTKIYWYKQSLGYQPNLISTLYVFSKSATFHDEFENNSRFSLDTETGKNHLKISDLQISDSAAYYCTSRYAYRFEFEEGIIVSVKGSGVNIPALVHQSASDTIQPGGSVTLNCTVHTGTCDGEHSVYWFKHSEEPHPGLIYTHGGRNDQCERKPDTQTHTCVYNLPMKSLNPPHAGIYYCAVVSCGHIVFGNGTKLDFEGSADEVESFVLVYVLIGALAFTTILVALLLFLICVIIKCAESQARFSTPSTANAEGYGHADNLLYAATSVSLPNRSRRQQNNAENECLYSSVKR
ncbi:uncharacterized protein LOC121626539 [Chelmon rostratus]|uniref:uncharacterized protein LOC121626539 n=1 Tax=Chelmon rostratus TaxID=109905 RepID=UPI001BE6B7D7|nr:uncharacterized protein LOC121626539 [Chelmon rostratus]